MEEIMDPEPSITKVTPEAIEAALSAYHSEPGPPAGQLSDQTRIFANIVAESDELKGALLGIAGALRTDAQREDFDLREVQRLGRFGKLNDEFLLKVAALCEQFFWVGWHARGAIDDAAKLRDSGL
jgi:hypothetical protein